MLLLFYTGEVFDTQFLIMATGCLSASKMPEVPGIESFRGATYHTAHWPAEGVEFIGQRVAVIGTGSSGIQVIPIIAQQASELTVFQRTPSFSIPAGNRSLTPNEVEDWKDNHQINCGALRNTFWGVLTGPLPTKSALEVTEEERNATYQKCWEKGTIAALAGAYYDLLVNKEANDTVAEFVRAKICSIVKDPDIAEALSPRTHPFSTKRVCVDIHYYDTFNLPNVHLVDVRKTPIVEITETGVRTGGGSNPGSMIINELSSLIMELVVISYFVVLCMSTILVLLQRAQKDLSNDVSYDMVDRVHIHYG